MEELISGRPDAPVTPPPGPMAVLDLTGEPGPARAPAPITGITYLPPSRPPLPARMPFTQYVLEEADRFLGTAYLLTADPVQAEELLRRALTDAATGWRRSARDPDDDVLRALARRSAGPWWTWWHRGKPGPDDEPVEAHLQGLSRRHRVALVLRYHQRLTEEQTAAAIGAPAGNVRSWISQALDQLHIDARLDLRPGAGPGLSRGDLSRELARLATRGTDEAARPGTKATADPPAQPDVHHRLLDIQSRLPAAHRRDRHRRAARAIAASVAAGGTLVGVLVLVGPAPDPRPPAASQPIGLGPAVPAPRSAGTPELFDPRNRAAYENRKPLRFIGDLAGDPLITSLISGRYASEVIIRFTPTTTSLTFTAFCRTPSGPALVAEATLNGHPLFSRPCDVNDNPDTMGLSRDNYPSTTDGGWSDLGVRAGKESVARIRLTDTHGAPVPHLGADADTRIGIAVYGLTGPRLLSDGVIIKRQAVDGDGHPYRLSQARTLPITPARRRLTLTVPAESAPPLVLYGSTGPGDRLRFTVDNAEVDARGPVRFYRPLPASRLHRLGLRARADDTGVMILAWYRRTE